MLLFFLLFIPPIQSPHKDIQMKHQAKDLHRPGQFSCTEPMLRGRNSTGFPLGWREPQNQPVPDFPKATQPGLLGHSPIPAPWESHPASSFLRQHLATSPAPQPANQPQPGGEPGRDAFPLCHMGSWVFKASWSRSRAQLCQARGLLPRHAPGRARCAPDVLPSHDARGCSACSPACHHAPQCPQGEPWCQGDEGTHPASAHLWMGFWRGSCSQGRQLVAADGEPLHSLTPAKSGPH